MHTHAVSHPFPAHDSIELVGGSAATAHLRRQIERAARTDAKVLILGETGVGKEIVARMIHDASARRARPFVAVNCSGIPEPLLESELFGHTRGSFTDAYADKPGMVRQAEQGTLFLDELGEMSARMQAVLLRFAETGELQPVGSTAPARRANVRLITATNSNLRDQIRRGGFREDLFFRLNVIEIRIPPLRDRPDDIGPLFDHFLLQASGVYGLPVPQLTPAAAQALREYAWPGNVRELRNVTEQLVLAEHVGPIGRDHLPEDVQAGAGATAARTFPAASLPLPLAEMPAPSPLVTALWDRLVAGGDFWTVVHQPFRARAITRQDLLSLVHRGLTHTHGSYRVLLSLFNLPPGDYKRFLAFLHQHRCNLPVRPYRYAEATRAGG